MNVLHVCAGWAPTNGAAVIARLLAGEQESRGDAVSLRTWASVRELRSADEVWIHCGWLPCLWWAALWAKRTVWVPEGCYDPVRLAYHGWKKRLAGPFERWALRRCRRIVATCEAERGWIRRYLGGRCPPVDVTDIRRFFDLTVPIVRPQAGRHAEPLHLLYLGRRHPLKGLAYLERAVSEINGRGRRVVELRMVSNADEREKERVWEWCDVLCLPTLSDNLGLVVAEALAHGRPVITTDGAPAWSSESGPEGPRVVSLEGYRDGTDEIRVKLLRDAILSFAPMVINFNTETQRHREEY